MQIQTMTWLCLLSPLSASIIARLLVMCPKKMSWLVTFAVAVSFWMSMSLFYHLAYFPKVVNLFQYTYMKLGVYQIHFGFWLDTLSVLMALMVSGISLLVCLYSIGYMKGEENISQFFSYIGFFCFAMLWLVFSDNLLQLFFGWEGVGVASYLLIGFWFEKEKASYASTKAFLLNRVGDIGLLIAMGLLFTYGKSIAFDDVLIPAKSMHSILYGYKVIDLVGLCLLMAAMAKSAQIPLHLWLPDSMVGPTPISALIHAATMVTAGIFLLSRFSAWFVISPFLQSIALTIGLMTVILMGLVAMTEYNLKRIIAYSTISQLGNMLACLALSGSVFSIYHLITHAVFKALLFLTAGAIIIAMDHQEDVRDMRGLKNERSIHIAMIIGLMSLCALPPTGGFFSKDSILVLAHMKSAKIYWLLLIGSMVTAMYSARLYCLLFWDNKPAVINPIPSIMNKVLWVLIVLSLWVGIGLIPLMPYLAKSLSVSKEAMVVIEHLGSPMAFTLGAINKGFILMIFSLLSVPYLWEKFSYRPGILVSGFGMETLLTRLIRVYGKLSRFLATITEVVIDYICVVVSTFWALFLGKRARELSTGKLNHYLWIVLFGMVFMIKSIL